MSETLLTLLPMVFLFIFLWLAIIFSRKQGRTYEAHVDRVSRINEEILESNRRMLKALEDIRTILQDRKN